MEKTTSRSLIQRLACAAVIATSIPISAYAEESRAEREDPMAYAGVLLGRNGSTSHEGAVAPALGVTVGIKVARSLGVSFFGSYYGQESSGSLLGLPTGTSSNTLVLAGQVQYLSGGLHLGAEMGVARSSWDGRISTVHLGDSTAAVVFGPVAGYDLKLGQAISVGVEGHYLISTVKSGVDNLQVLAALKLWQ